jgi:ferrous iron transport protein A
VIVQTMPLSFVSPGTETTVASINAAEELVKRLGAMGIHNESRVTVVCADRGSLIVSVAGSRYALSRGMAMKILVGSPGANGANGANGETKNEMPDEMLAATKPAETTAVVH